MIPNGTYDQITAVFDRECEIYFQTLSAYADPATHRVPREDRVEVERARQVYWAKVEHKARKLGYSLAEFQDEIDRRFLDRE